MENEINDEFEKLKEKIRDLESQNQKLKQNHQRIEKKVKRLENIQGTSKVVKFEINSEEEWNVIERNFHKTGILLEYEISEYIKETNLKFNVNESFIYPSDPGVFYIDYFFDKWDSVMPTFNSVELETDIKVYEDMEFSDENFNIKVKIIYIIECKSRTNPPINYLIIPDKPLNADYKTDFVLNGSNILNKLSIESDFFIKTKNKIVGVRYPNFNIDKVKTFNKGFWELFRSIDYELNYYKLNNPKFFNYTFFKEMDIPDKDLEDLEIPQYCEKFRTFYKDWLKADKVPKKLKKPIYLNFKLFVPIIVVNGNIYSIDLPKGKGISFYEKQKKIPCFIKNFNNLMESTIAPFKYNSLNDNLMMGLSLNIIPIDKSYYEFYYCKLMPDIDIIFISSNNFLEVFEKIRNITKESLTESIQEKLEKEYLKRKDHLMRLQVFRYMIVDNDSLEFDLISKCYESYVDSLNKKRRFFKRETEDISDNINNNEIIT